MAIRGKLDITSVIGKAITVASQHLHHLLDYTALRYQLKIGTTLETAAHVFW
jgi:hypothetical protein